MSANPAPCSVVSMQKESESEHESASRKHTTSHTCGVTHFPRNAICTSVIVRLS